MSKLTQVGEILLAAFLAWVVVTACLVVYLWLEKRWLEKRKEGNGK